MNLRWTFLRSHRGFEPNLSHLSKNVSFIVRLGSLRPAQTFICEVPIFLRRHDTLSDGAARNE
jgi:hypothetical protein